MQHDWLRTRAHTTPDQLALISNDHQTRWTYHDLHDRADEFTRYVRRGQTIGLLMPNHPDTVALIFAALRVGAVMVPLNTRMTYDEIRWQLQNTDCTTLLVHRTLRDHLPYDLPESDDAIQQVYLPKVDDAFTRRPASLDDSAPITLQSPAAIVHTSGTSGTPKGAVLSYGNFFYSAMSSAYRIGHLPDDRWLCVLPLFHVGGISILVRACLYGITVDLHSRFDVERINHALTHDDTTLISLVPTMLYRLLQHGTPSRWQALRLVLLGGAAATPELMQQCIDRQIPVATTYGLSEASSQVATTTPGVAARKPGTVGKPLMFTQVRVVDENDTDVPTGEYGEIIVQSPTVMKGYYNQPDATAETLRGGWLHTGDIGYLDDDGDLFLVQRRSDLIITGGENVYPAEVEAALRTHPAIQQAAVVGLDDPEWGQRVAAAVVLQEDANLTPDAIDAYAREHLAGYKIPRAIQIVSELPETSSGKIKRPAVQALFRP